MFVLLILFKCVICVHLRWETEKLCKQDIYIRQRWGYVFQLGLNFLKLFKAHALIRSNWKRLNVYFWVKRAWNIYKQRLDSYGLACSLARVNICTNKSRGGETNFSIQYPTKQPSIDLRPTTLYKEKEPSRHLSVIAPHALPIFPIHNRLSFTILDGTHETIKYTNVQALTWRVQCLLLLRITANFYTQASKRRTFTFLFYV